MEAQVPFRGFQRLSGFQRSCEELRGAASGDVCEERERERDQAGSAGRERAGMRQHTCMVARLCKSLHSAMARSLCRSPWIVFILRPNPTRVQCPGISSARVQCPGISLPHAHNRPDIQQLNVWETGPRDRIAAVRWRNPATAGNLGVMQSNCGRRLAPSRPHNKVRTRVGQQGMRGGRHESERRQEAERAGQRGHGGDERQAGFRSASVTCRRA